MKLSGDGILRTVRKFPTGSIKEIPSGGRTTWKNLTIKTRYLIIVVYNSLIMDYKPYSVEWSRRRYLAEAIQQYFDTDAPVDVILDDIVNILHESVVENQTRADKFQEVINGMKFFCNKNKT